MALKRATRSTKSPPIFSHEFVIQNHADIVSCIAMLIVIGLLFQFTAPLTTIFVALQHNATEPIATPTGTIIYYSTGPRDFAIIFFYFLISIIIHAVIQEYVLDRINRKLHLSKTKNYQFNESGQQLTFFLASLLWAGEIIRREGYLFPISRIWSNYPTGHIEMSYILKFYFIIQISYWLHTFPELYLQKVKREEINTRILHSTFYLAFITIGYVLNFTRITLILSVLHYAAEALFHVARLLEYANKAKLGRLTFRAWNILFPIARLSSFSLSFLTFWYGLPSVSTVDSTQLGNYNTPLIRLTLLCSISVLQACLMWDYINFHLRERREKAEEAARKKKNQAAKAAAAAKKLSDEVDELPEADQEVAVASTPSSSKKSSRTKLKQK